MSELGKKQEAERGRRTTRKRNRQKNHKKTILLLLIALCVFVIAGFAIVQIMKKREAAEALRLEQLKKQQEALVMPMESALECAKPDYLEKALRKENEALLACLAPKGVEELFANNNPYTPEEVATLIADGTVSEKKTTKEVLMILTQAKLPTEKVTQFAAISRCEIDKDNKAKVKIEVEAPYVPVSDDDYYYLFELATYEKEHGIEYVEKTSKWKETPTFSIQLNHNSASSRLYSKFVVAVLVDGQFIDITRGHYVTNPEAIAKYTEPHKQASSIKGLIVDPSKIGGSEIEDLGVNHAAYNIPLSFILGHSTSAAHPTVYYDYNGKTYAFNGARLEQFDYAFRELTKKGTVITAVILNDRNGAYPQLIHPDAAGGSAPYYMFNATNEDGCETMAAVASFLANRYSGTGKGKISNWVIGNEINARTAWNYMSYTSVDEYAQAYAQAYRIFYNGIKSVDASANVYISLDQMWDRNLKATDSYDAKDVLDAFNTEISLKGNIDWGLAHHPYPVPLTWPKFWDMPSNYRSMNLVRNSVDTPYITVQNIHVLTEYMSREEMLNPNGEVRSIALTEVGFGSDHGEELQAAAFAYAYMIVSNNQHIDMFILNKQADMIEEISQGLSMGINRTNGTHKYIYNVFKYIDTDSADEVTAFARSMIGISDWSEVITER